MWHLAGNWWQRRDGVSSLSLMAEASSDNQRLSRRKNWWWAKRKFTDRPTPPSHVRAQPSPARIRMSVLDLRKSLAPVLAACRPISKVERRERRNLHTATTCRQRNGQPMPAGLTRVTWPNVFMLFASLEQTVVAGDRVLRIRTFGFTWA